jgi:hypothetical protein
MKNNYIMLAVLGVGGYLAYTMYKKSQDSKQTGYLPTPSSQRGKPAASKADQGGKFDINKAMNLLENIYNKGNFIYLSLTKKKRAAEDLKMLIDQGKSQQEIEIYMANKYGLTATDVKAMVNKLYA